MKIVFLDAYSLADIDMAPLKSLGRYQQYGYTPQEKVIERADGAEVVVVNKVLMTAEIMDALPELRLICVAATGLNNVDLEYAQKKGVTVKNVAGYSTESVAEATFAFVLALLRNVRYYDTYVKSGEYTESGMVSNTSRRISEIKGKRWGIIGLGAIGGRVAEIASFFGAQVSYYSASGAERTAGYERKTLEDLLAESDIVSIHAPLNESTYGIIDHAKMILMKPTAILVNMGRGGIVNEADLARALEEGVIAGAGLDVFEQEPVSEDNPLLRLRDENKLIAAPHCGWASVEARTLLVEKLAENIREHKNRD